MHIANLHKINDGRILELLESGIQVCDLGCGEGVALCLMAERFSSSRFTGIDNHEGAIKMARSSAAELGLTNLEFFCEGFCPNQGAAGV